MNYHFETSIISRGKGRSITGAVSYISGRTLRDCYSGKTYRNRRHDVVWQKIFLPVNAPIEFRDFQHPCDEIETAEVRWDARTGRHFIGSLPNELPPRELIRIVHEFIADNFVAQDLCAIAAIHRGHNSGDPSKNNPHVHIIVPTRTVNPDGFNPKKDREHNKRRYIGIWRAQWAAVQNRAYERNRLDIRVSHERLEVQGERGREPTIHLSRIDWQREQRGERTPAGDRKRAIQERNRERQLEQELGIEVELDKQFYGVEFVETDQAGLSLDEYLQIRAESGCGKYRFLIMIDDGGSYNGLPIHLRTRLKTKLHRSVYV